jgi:hypothetical protein
LATRGINTLGKFLRRKYILALLALVSAAKLGYGQAFFGFKAGANANRILYSEDLYKDFYNTKVSFGYTGGVLFLYENKEKYGFYTEILYSQIGKSIDSDANDFETHTAQYNYLDVPIMFRIKFKQPKFNWYLMLGPQLSYWLGGKGQYTVYDPSRDEFASYDYKVNFGEVNPETQYLNVEEGNRLQISFSVGGGLMWELDNANFVAFDARFALGNTFVGGYESASIPNIGLVDNLEYTNNVLTLSAIYYFNILEKVRLSKNKYRKR